MSAARYDLVIDQGSDFAVEFTVAEASVVKNLTGYSARAQLRPVSYTHLTLPTNREV